MLTKSSLKLAHPPIVEAVLDIDCDMPATFELAGIETAVGDAFRDRYPKLKKQFFQGIQVEPGKELAAKVTTSQGLQALQFLHEDERQLVQVRRQGFSFNRLAPYSSLDDYLPEMARTWNLFVGLVAPIQVRQIRLRFINRILLPSTDGKVELNNYFTCGPKLPDEERLSFVGFFHQHAAVEDATGHRVNIVLAAQPIEGDRLPIIFDIEAQSSGFVDVGNWNAVSSNIQALRDLKNAVFERTLTQLCVNLFQH